MSKYSNSTNVYGPRPKDCGFHCMHCDRDEPPLFGVALLCPKRQPRERHATYAARFKDWETERNVFTSCLACLSKCRLVGRTLSLTEDARAALEVGSSAEPGTRKR